MVHPTKPNQLLNSLPQSKSIGCWWKASSNPPQPYGPAQLSLLRKRVLFDLWSTIKSRRAYLSRVLICYPEWTSASISLEKHTRSHRRMQIPVTCKRRSTNMIGERPPLAVIMAYTSLNSCSSDWRERPPPSNLQWRSSLPPWSSSWLSST